jgi:hypothetical protein
MLSLPVGKLEGFERAVVGPPAFSSVATLNLKVFGLARSYGEGGMVNIVLGDAKDFARLTRDGAGWWAIYVFLF